MRHTSSRTRRTPSRVRTREYFRISFFRLHRGPKATTWQSVAYVLIWCILNIITTSCGKKQLALVRGSSKQFYGDSTSDGKSRRNDLVSTIRGLKRLSLKTAAIVISDDGVEQDCMRQGMTHIWTHERYSLDQKRKWVRDLEKLIL